MNEATLTKPRPKVVETLLADKHSIPLSIALHLVPGALIVAIYAFVAAPLVRAIDCPPFMAWAIALAVVLFPLLLGLAWLGKQVSGRYCLRGGAVKYMDRPLSRGKVTAFIIPCLLWMTIVSLSLTPLDNLLYDTAFSWIHYAGTGNSATSYLNGYSQEILLTTFLICGPFTGWFLPLIEEYYFRGFLLPRLPQLRGWAPFFNVFFFSVYHFWAPWTVLSKLVFLYPGVHLAWKKRDIRISIGMHPGSALLLTIVGVTAIAMGRTSL